MADHSEHSVRHEVGLQAGSLLHPASGSSQGVLQLSSLLTLPHDENTIVDLIKRTEQAETDTRPGQDDESRIAGITRQWTETSLTSSHHGTPPPKHLTRSHDGAPLTTTHALRQGSSRMSPSASRKSDTSNSGESKVLRNSTGDSYVNTKYTANIRTEEHGRATSMNTRGPSQQPVPSALKGRNYIWVMNLDPNTPLTVIVHRERSKARVTEMEANASATGGGIKVGIQVGRCTPLCWQQICSSSLAAVLSSAELQGRDSSVQRHARQHLQAHSARADIQLIWLRCLPVLLPAKSEGYQGTGCTRSRKRGIVSLQSGSGRGERSQDI